MVENSLRNILELIRDYPVFRPNRHFPMVFRVDCSIANNWMEESAAIPRATRLDLSNNLLIKLPDDFITLTHLVKLDLSKNSLTQLPERLGNLQKLQQLDLLGNYLTSLPVSIHFLKNLKWLDLKDNPLESKLKEIAGDCLDESQCRSCAKNVVAYYKMVESEMERERQKNLQREREIEVQLDAKKRADEDREKQRKKAEKQAEKEKKRREYESRLAEKKNEVEPENADTLTPKSHAKREDTAVAEKSGMSCSGVLWSLFISIFALFLGVYFFCDTNVKNPYCKEIHHQTKHYYVMAGKYFEKLFEKVISLAD